LPEKHLNPSSVTLSAPVWNLLPFAGKPILVIEQRDEGKRVASFSVFNYERQRFQWRDVVLPEKWWLNLAGVTQDHVVIKVFESTENPDKTSLLFLSVEDGKVEDLAFQQNDWLHTNDTVQPFHYLDGEPDFETVKNFLKSKIEITPRLSAEYLEYDGYIIISYYIGDPAAFVNRLVVFNSMGEEIYQEEIGTNLKGIGINTFFIASGILFFVKNRTELVTFRIV
jgi:Domain of unknown function (DUF4905)